MNKLPFLDIMRFGVLFVFNKNITNNDDNHDNDNIDDGDNSGDKQKS